MPPQLCQGLSLALPCSALSAQAPQIPCTLKRAKKVQHHLQRRGLDLDTLPSSSRDVSPCCDIALCYPALHR